MLRDLIPRFWFPLSIGSDNGPTFVAELLQLVCKAVNIKWKLHTAYRPQSSGMVEGMNQTIKVTLIKWLQEIGAPCMDMLPLVLMRMRMTHRLHGYFPVWANVWEASPTYSGQRGWMEVLRQLEQLGKVIHDITYYVHERIQFSLGTTTHPYIARRFSMGRVLEAADVVPHLEKAIHNCSNHSHCS